MFVIRRVLRMAGGGAGEYGIISRVCMTIGTGVPLVFVFPGVDREILTVVVPICRGPCSLSVAVGAGCWKLRSCMRRTGCLVVVYEVAADTCVGSSVIISVMAIDAIVRYDNMSACQNIIIVVDRESGRRPVWIGGMTGIAIGRDVDGGMIRVCRGVIIRHMTSGAGIGRIYVIPLMTCKTIGGNGRMGACKRVNIVMIEC